MIQIPLTQGKTALIDDEDLPLVEVYNWQAECRGNTWYARGRIEGRLQYMHRVITRASSDQEVDHRDWNGLNNQQYNLRLTDRTGNNLNRRGVHGYEKHGSKYRARMFVRGKRIELGSFDTIEEARAAYLAAKLEMS